MGVRYRVCRLIVAFTAGASAIVAIAARASAQQIVTLPPIEVLGITPIPGSELIAASPANVQTIPSSDFDHAISPSLVDAMTRALPGVSRGDQTGNPFQPDIDYRGFSASPVPGTPQGLAVYQNGARINETFGDTVNWDLIPEMAVNRMTLTPNNPVYGLNALGGAISIEMKNGFNYQGAQAELRGGSYGRVGAYAQAGGQKGNLSGYITADAVNDTGWRDFSSSSQLRRMYLDLGARGDQAEFHLSFTGADNRLGSVAATPVEMLNQRWSSVYTWPQNTHNQLVFLQASANYNPTDTVLLQAIAYYRGFRQSHVDGNTTDAQPCAMPGVLCFGDDATPLLNFAGTQVPDVFGSNLGQIDRTWTSANTFGGALQAKSTAKMLNHDNHFVFGASIDHGLVRFAGNSELGQSFELVRHRDRRIDPAAGRGSFAGEFAYAKYLYGHLCDRYDRYEFELVCDSGCALQRCPDQVRRYARHGTHSDSRFSHLNPVIGLTYKIMPNVTAYAGYSQANRAPTPLELGISDPAHPCLIDTFLISDPPLKQVVSYTYEAGLRGSEFGQKLKWNIGAYRTISKDDIISVASEVSGFGFFQNAAKTRRQGIEAGLTYKEDRWRPMPTTRLSMTTFQTPLTLSSPHNPAADADGNIFVAPGDKIPGIPQQRFKVGFEYSITQPWTVGADLNAVGSQYLIGDQSNQNPKVPAYWVVNLHSSKINKNVEVFGLVQNLFNQHYYAAGRFSIRRAYRF